MGGFIYIFHGRIYSDKARLWPDKFPGSRGAGVLACRLTHRPGACSRRPQTLSRPFHENPPGGASFGGGWRWLDPCGPPWGCAGLAALATVKIRCRRTPFNFKTSSKAQSLKPSPNFGHTIKYDITAQPREAQVLAMLVIVVHGWFLSFPRPAHPNCGGSRPQKQVLLGLTRFDQGLIYLYSP